MARKAAKAAPAGTKARRLATELADAPDDVELQRVFADALLDQGGEHAIRGELIQRLLAGKPVDDLVLEGHGLDRVGGFARSWTCRAEDFAAHAREVFADEPLLRGLVIKLSHREIKKQLATFAATPELARVKRLTLVGHKQRTGRPGSKGLAVLFGSPYWPRLEALAVPTCAIGDAGAKLLAKTASLGELRELDVSHNDLLAGSVVALAASPYLAQLTRLDLRGNKPGDRGIQALVDSTHITRLAWIDTSMTWLAPINVRPLKKRWPDLEHVHNPHVVY